MRQEVVTVRELTLFQLITCSAHCVVCFTLIIKIL